MRKYRTPLPRNWSENCKLVAIIIALSSCLINVVIAKYRLLRISVYCTTYTLPFYNKKCEYLRGMYMYACMYVFVCM